MHPLVLFLLLLVSPCLSQEETEHRDFQYNSGIDPLTGAYNFAYDTGHDNDIAHSTHMQYRDPDGTVRGRYGYTDPNGKLRVVEYEAGAGGFVARGDVGPDQFPHDQKPGTELVGGRVSGSQMAQFNQLDDGRGPSPVQMAGWDPIENPIIREVVVDDDATATGGANETGENEGTYDSGYSAFSFSEEEGSDNRESESLKSSNEVQSEDVSVYSLSAPLTINDIDVNPDEIRESAASSGPVRRSADGGDRLSSQATGYRVVYKTPHDHSRERITHDHDAERRYYVSRRQTHDHDAERKYVSNKQSHDHDAEQRYLAHTHDGVKRQTHNHYAERPYYHYSSPIYYSRNSAYYRERPLYWRDGRPVYRRRVYYRDSHSNVPHEHYTDNLVYYNDPQTHRHSDMQLYRDGTYPATTRPSQLKYIPSDKYHGKYYYWTD